MAYTLRARNNHTLSHNGKEYSDGDRIVISKADAERIAGGSQAYRFEDADGDTVVTPIATSATMPAVVAEDAAKK